MFTSVRVSCLRSLLVAGIIAVMPFAAAHLATAQTSSANEWTWMSGSSTANATGVYGTLGVAATGNVPGARDSAVSWTDSSGNLWLFGGEQESGGTPDFNDLWEYSPTTNKWTWINGSNTTGASGVFGTKGVTSSANVPPARGEGAVGWIDRSNNLWLFGGYGDNGNRNDLWEFNPSNKEWTWVSGSSTAEAVGVYGTLGVAAASNVPAARGHAISWIDSSGNLWLFGGFDDEYSTGIYGYLNDLWEFSPTTNEWTWVSGKSTANASGVYGTLGIAATSNVPGARNPAVGWTDSSGNFWLFGGSGVDSIGTQGNLNDLWEFSPATKQWTWVSGANSVGSNGSASGVYGTLGVAAVGNVPGGRYSAISWIDSSGRLWLFGGYGVDSTAKQGNLNDLWEFSPATKQWTWASGANSVGSTGVAPGVYGTLGVAATGNIPGGRSGAASWIDSSGKLWLFGGNSSDSTFSLTQHNDLWEYQLPTTTPTVTVTPSLTSITTIQGLTVTVAVSAGSGSQTVTGSVVLTGGGYTSPSTALSSGSANITIPTGSLAVGTDTLTATYTPDSASAPIYATASGSSSVAVSASATTLTLSANPTSSTYGQQVVLIATLSPYSAQSISTNGESVTFYNGSTSLGTGTVSSGVATLNMTALPVGTDSLKAVYAGDANFTASTSSTLPFTVANPLPAISSLSPAFTNAGGAAFTLTVNGSGFIAGSTVYWGTSALTTTYVSATQLTAQVPATDIAAAGTNTITVQSPAPGGGTSNAWQFEVDTASTGTGPTLTSTTETVAAGSTASYPVTVPTSVTSVSVTCLNLPTGATCSYSPTTNLVSIATSSTTPKGTYQIIVVFTETVTTTSFLLPILLLPLGFIRRNLAARGIWLTACLGLVLLATAALSIGCGGGGSGSSTPPSTQQVTSSGAVTLTIQ